MTKKRRDSVQTTTRTTSERNEYNDTKFEDYKRWPKRMSKGETILMDRRNSI